MDQDDEEHSMLGGEEEEGQEESSDLQSIGEEDHYGNNGLSRQRAAQRPTTATLLETPSRIAAVEGEEEEEEEEEEEGDDANDILLGEEGIESKEVEEEEEEEVVPLDSKAFQVSWIDEIIIDKRQMMKNPNYRVQSHVLRQWKGAEWSLLLVIRPEEGSYTGAYIGYDHPEKLPSGWMLHSTYRIVMLRRDNQPACYTKSVDYLFTGGEFSPPQRVDQGEPKFCPFNNLQECGRPIDANRFAVRFQIEITERFVPMRVPLHYNSKQMTGMVGIENLGATCYLNSLLQMLFHLNSFREAVYNLPVDAADLSQSTTFALQSLFYKLQVSKKEVTTKDLTRAFGWTTAEAFMQQDVQEMMRVLLDKLEEKVEEYHKITPEESDVDVTTNHTNGHTNFVKSLFAGRIKSYIHCMNIDYQSNREEDFYDIQLDVKNCRNIYDSFKKYVAIEMLDGDNQYYCDEYKGKYDAKKGVIFTHFPPILTIHLKRFDFDLQTMNFMKIHDHYEFPSILYLDDFLDHDKNQKEEKSGDDGLEEKEGDQPTTPNTYILHSVLVHSGDVGGGHYFAYIRPATQYNLDTVYNIDYVRKKIENSLAHPQSNGNGHEVDGSNAIGGSGNIAESWYKFNDEVVMKVTELEAIHYYFGRRYHASHHRMSEPAAKHDVDEDHIQHYWQVNSILTDQADQHNNIDYNLTTFASAYMLVYIRLEDAQQIMKPMPESSIPQSLINTIQPFERQRELATYMRMRDKALLRIRYATENDLYAFQDYSLQQTFVSDKEMKWLTVSKGTTYLGLIILLAKEMKVLPIYISLWQISVQSVGTGSHKFNSYRLVDNIPMREYDIEINAEEVIFFVQLLYNTSSSRLLPSCPIKGSVQVDRFSKSFEVKTHVQLENMLECLGEEYNGYNKIMHNIYNYNKNIQCLHDLLPHEELKPFIVEYRSLLAKEEAWRNNLRSVYMVHMEDKYQEVKQFLSNVQAGDGGSPDGIRALFEDATFGCGIGLPNEALNNLLNYDKESYTRLTNEIRILTRDMKHALKEFGYHNLGLNENAENEEEASATVLVPIKIFDPYNLIHYPAHIPSPTSLDPAGYSKSTYPKREKPADTFQEGISMEEAKDPAGHWDSALLSSYLDLDSIDFDTHFFISAKPSEEYNPIKYVGYLMVDADHVTMNDILKQIMILLSLNHMHYDERIDFSRLLFDLFLLTSTTTNSGGSVMQVKKIDGASLDSDYLYQIIEEEMSVTIICGLTQPTRKLLKQCPTLPLHVTPLAVPDSPSSKVSINLSQSIYRHRHDRIANEVYSKRDILDYNFYIANQTKEMRGGGLSIYDPNYQRLKHKRLTKDIADPSSSSEDEGVPAGGETVFDPKAYLSYRSTKKECIVVPYEARDLRVLLQIYRYFNINGCSSLRRRASISSGKRKRKGDDGDHSDASNRFPICAGFVFDVSLRTKVSSLVAMISNRLHIHYGHLSLIVVDENFCPEGVYTVQPVHYLSDENYTLSQCLPSAPAKPRGFQRNRVRRIFVFYKILDYNLVETILVNHRLASGSLIQRYLNSPADIKEEQRLEEGKRNALVKKLMDTPYSDLEKEYKVLDLLLVDAKLRFWRKLFLEHLQGLSDNHNLNISNSIYRQNTRMPVEEIIIDDSSSNQEEEEAERSRQAKRQKAEMGTNNVAAPLAPPSAPATLLPAHTVSSADLAAIDWPQSATTYYLDNPYAERSVKTVILRVPVATTIGQVCDEARSLIGLPENMSELLENHHNTGLIQSYVQQFSSTGESQSRLDQMDLSSLLSDQLHASVVSASSFPLIIANVKFSIIDEIVCSTTIVGYTKPCWGDLITSLDMLGQLTVQSVEPADLPYMVYPPVSQQVKREDVVGRSARSFDSLPKEITAVEESIVLSVFYFTLYGGGCEICEPHLFNGPFLTYIKRSDSYTSFVERLVRMTGDADMVKYRLAVVNRRKEPAFIIKPNNNGGGHGGGGLSTSESEENESNQGWLWEFFAKRYSPNTHWQDISEGSREDRFQYQRFAWLGIQRSVSDVQAEVAGSLMAIRYRGQASTGIKIS